MKKIAWLLLVAGFMGLAVFVISRPDNATAAEKLCDGVQIGGLPVGNLTRFQAGEAVKNKISGALRDGWIFRLTPNEYKISEPQKYVNYDVAAAVDQAFAVGHSSSWFRNLITRWRLRWHDQNIPLASNLDRDAVEKWLHAQVRESLVPPADAALEVSLSDDGRPFAEIKPEKIGQATEIAPALDELDRQAAAMDFQPINLRVTLIQPRWTAVNLQPLLEQIPAILSHAPFKVSGEGKSWTVTTSTLARWIGAVDTDSGLILDLDPEKTAEGLTLLAADVLAQPKNGKLVMDGDKIKEFVTPVEGVVLNVTSSIDIIKQGWAAGSSTIPLVIDHVVPQLTGPDAERLGVREILGIGRSNFVGSPVNRRKNIALGVKLLDGLLIEPDEEFSLLKALGTIDGTKGWLPELVIKDNKTIPEFGGGLCQIGTTTFRTALQSGLPITMRQNHSYRVPYYEPAGTDATIYDPWPDLRFKNDTGHWIMVTTQLKGNDLAFTFWGTRDGRAVAMTAPKIWNVTPPPPKQEIETLDLAPGTTKCTERAHAGADASFDYTVTAAGGDGKKMTFFSHYKAWGAVCLIGVKQLTASSTQPAVDETGINNPN